MRSRIILVGLAVIFSSVVGKADQVPLGDPIIKTGGRGTGAFHPPGLAGGGAIGVIHTLNFTIESPTGNSPVSLPNGSPCVLTQGTNTKSISDCLFLNVITDDKGVGQKITSLIFDAPTVPFDMTKDQCGFLMGSPFLKCGVDPLTGGGTQWNFSDGSIAFDSEFSLQFQGFDPNTSFNASKSTVVGVTPEPGTFELILISGLAAAFARIRMRMKA